MFTEASRACQGYTTKETVSPFLREGRAWWVLHPFFRMAPGLQVLCSDSQLLYPRVQQPHKKCETQDNSALPTAFTFTMPDPLLHPPPPESWRAAWFSRHPIHSCSHLLPRGGLSWQMGSFAGRISFQKRENCIIWLFDFMGEASYLPFYPEVL